MLDHVKLYIVWIVYFAQYMYDTVWYKRALFIASISKPLADVSTAVYSITVDKIRTF